MLAVLLLRDGSVCVCVCVCACVGGGQTIIP